MKAGTTAASAAAVCGVPASSSYFAAFFCAAHRFFCAAEIFARASADIVRRLRAPPVSGGLPGPRFAPDPGGRPRRRVAGAARVTADVPLALLFAGVAGAAAAAFWAAHRARCASPMAFLAAADIVRRLRFTAVTTSPAASDAAWALPLSHGIGPSLPMMLSAAARRSRAISSRCAIQASTLAMTVPRVEPTVFAAFDARPLPGGRPRRFFFAKLCLQFREESLNHDADGFDVRNRIRRLFLDQSRANRP